MLERLKKTSLNIKKKMNWQATWISPLSFHIVIPSLSLLVIGCYFLSLFLYSFPFPFYFFQSLLELLYQVFKPSHYGISIEHILMFFYFLCFFFLSLISKGIYRVFLVFFYGFPQRLIKTQFFNQNKRVLDKY